MTPSKNLLAILTELTEDAQQIDQLQLEQVQSLILNAKRIFVAGAGRSGFAARAFSNRLMHLPCILWASQLLLRFAKTT